MATFLNQQSKRLPIEDVKDEIVQAVRQHSIVIIYGDTGSGKTTQVPQYLYNAGLNNNKTIAVTQPRRIAAINMAKRVAEEMQCSIGSEVGYEVRFETNVSSRTKIKFVTDGMMLVHCMLDRMLSEYGIVMIDEAHERCVETDVIFCLIKRLTRVRPDLKVVISSATLETEKFSKYFDSAPVIRFSGRMYKVTERYRKPLLKDYFLDVVRRVGKIHRKCLEGDVLVFLTGQEEIEDCCEALEATQDLVVLPLYGAMDYYAQQQVFKPVVPPQRKVVVATNIAETSITIDGIRFVVDCGYVKQNHFNPQLGISQLKSVRVSKEQANQRKGRAGRTNTGWCYRLYEQKDYELFDEETKPEIYRRNLSEIYLKLVFMNIDPIDFDFMDKPDAKTLVNCKQELQDLDLLDSDGSITELGIQMVDFPVEPITGKVLLSSVKYGCSLDVVNILAMLTERNIFIRGRKKRKQANICRKRFFSLDGDHFTLLDVFREWETNGKTLNWCRANFINYKTMQRVDLAKSQLVGIMKRKGLLLESISSTGDKVAIKKAFMEGFYKNICRKTYLSQDDYTNVYNRQTVCLHPSSPLYRTNTSMILYHEVVQTKRPYMYGVMAVDNSLLQQFPQQMKKIKYESNDLDSLFHGLRLNRF